MRFSCLLGCALTFASGAMTAATAQVASQPSPRAQAQPTATGPHLGDRGAGVATSMFGTYIRRGEVIAYPFFEYYHHNNFEYKPSEFGAVGDVDFRGRYRVNEGLFLFAYGLGDDVAFEVEGAGIRASLFKSPDDRSAMPDRIVEAGLGDVEGQVRWRWRRETDRRPELFSYAEAVVPHGKGHVLIGTPGWELKFGTGLTRGFP